MFGLKKRIIDKLKYECGITKLEEDYDSLYFLLNNVIDITKLPEAKDKNLRMLQKCDAILLAIFDALCNKYNLTYWIDWGTLLGAVRHHGSIPWDNDVDVSMTRDDQNKVIPLMKEEIEKYGLSLEPSPMKMHGDVLSYKKESTGLWVDIFPVDPFFTDKDKDEVKKMIPQYRNIYWKHSQDWSIEKLQSIKYEILRPSNNPKNKFLVPNLETWSGDPKLFVYNIADILPVTRIKYETFEVNAPSNFKEYLVEDYGNHYMEFPRRAINTHGISCSPVDTIIKHKTDMNIISNELTDIYTKISES